MLENIQMILDTFMIFSPKDIYLGELMPTVRVARVRGWADVGACSAEGVGDGPDPADGRLGHHSRRSGPARRATPAYASRTAQRLILLAYSRCYRSFLARLRPPGRAPVRRAMLPEVWRTHPRRAGF